MVISKDFTKTAKATTSSMANPTIHTSLRATHKRSNLTI
jgi:hypothetical protein